MAKPPKTTLVDRELIQELSKLLDETGLTEIEIEQDGQRIRVARGSVAVAAAPAPVVRAAAAPQPVGESTSKPMDAAKHPGVVNSPMVGTAYMAAEPGARPFIEVGSKVKAGDTLLIIEAMKTMNQIASDRAGKVTKILIQNANPVEFGQPLFVIE